MKQLRGYMKYSTLVATGVLFQTLAMAEVVIPPSCSTPGSCPELNVTAKQLTVNQRITLESEASSHTTTIEVPKGMANSVKIALPKHKPDPNQILVVDNNGTLIWQEAPDKDRFLGMIGYMIPDSAEHIYEINGQTVTDAKLAAYINNHPISGFSVSGNDVTMPDWRGRYMGARGGLGISDTAGATLGSTNKRHSHTLNCSIALKRKNSKALAYSDGFEASKYPRNAASSAEGGTYARPMTVGMPIVIVGGSL